MSYQGRSRVGHHRLIHRGSIRGGFRVGLHRGIKGGSSCVDSG